MEVDEEDAHADLVRQQNAKLLFNYFDAEERDLHKKKFFNLKQDEAREVRNRSMYSEAFGTK